MKAQIRETLPPVYERHQVHILNPAAGAGRHFEAAKKAVEMSKGEMVFSERPGQVTEIVRELFIREPYAHAIVYGGDGTVFETVNGIMQSGHNDTASFSVIPAGSGNDFSTHANDSGQIEQHVLTNIDVVRTECGGKVRYFANMMNKKILLTACANGSYCGGGFHALPYADLSDGYLDVLVANDVSRLQFVKLVGDYRAGTYMDEHGVIRDKFSKVIEFVRCRRFEISGQRRVCLDGELFDTDAPLVAENVPGALWYVAV